MSSVILRFFITFIGGYIAQVGAFWGFLEAYTYFRDDSLKLMIGNYWSLVYILPVITSILFSIYYTRSKEESAGNSVTGQRIFGEIVGGKITIENYYSSPKKESSPVSIPENLAEQISEGVPQNPAKSNSASVLRMPRLENNDVYIERFAIKGHIGRGGFSDVYLTWDELNPDRREVVLKLFRYQGQERYVQSYIQREATMSLKLADLEGLAKTYEAKWLPQNYGMYLVQEFISSQNLHQYIESRFTIPTLEAVQITIKLSETLQSIHDRKIVHCDVKPLNVLIGPNNEPILIDYGAARFLGETLDKKQVVISIPYSGRELISGKPIDGRSDIYSLAMTLLHMLVGLPMWIKSPRRHVDFSTARLPPNPLSVMPTERELKKYIKNSFFRIHSEKLVACLEKALAPSPNKRFADMEEFRKELIECHESIAA